MALIDDLVSYWTLDETSGTREDSHASNDLTDNNTVGAATGVINDGADFELANSEYLSITDATQSGLDFTGDLSMSCWVKIESAPSGKYSIIEKILSSDESYNINYRESSGKKLQFIATSGGSGATENVWTFAQDLGTGTFKHIVMTFDASASTVEFFVDGSSIGTVTQTITSIYNGTAPFTVGGRAAGNFFDGIIDEMGVWSRVLTSDEVTELYNSGAGLAYPFTSTNIKTWNGVGRGDIKTLLGVASANIKTINGIT